MECNKDEAMKAKEMAETKFLAKDMVGAKKFALKAQSLHPELEGISQMLATLNVYVSAENKVHGESDWYGILGVNPMADDETIRKQFRKLALVLHPDKNKSVGADGAFNLISEAWSLLSDKAKRGLYDQKRRTKIYQRVSIATARSHVPPSSGSGSFNVKPPAYPPPSAMKVNKTASERVGQSQSSHNSMAGTFWTVCYGCKAQLEYIRAFANHNILCSICRVPFFASEVYPPPFNGYKWTNPWKFSQHQNQASGKETVNKGVNNVASSGIRRPAPQTTSHWEPFKGTGGAASTAAQAAAMVQKAYDKVKRVREEAQTASKREEALRRKQANKSSYNAANRSNDDDVLSNQAKAVTN